MINQEKTYGVSPNLLVDDNIYVYIYIHMYTQKYLHIYHHLPHLNCIIVGPYHIFG
jgi:hypothetical protein